MRSIGEPPDWKKLVITKGILEPPLIDRASVTKRTLSIKLSEPCKCLLGIAIFETKTKKFHYLGKRKCSKKFWRTAINSSAGRKDGVAQIKVEKKL